MGKIQEIVLVCSTHPALPFRETLDWKKPRAVVLFPETDRRQHRCFDSCHPTHSSGFQHFRLLVVEVLALYLR